MKKRLLIIFLCVLMVLPTYTVHASSKSPFSDINENHWAYTAIMDMVEKGIINGFPDGTFRPNDPVTREQFAKILVLAMDIPLSNPSQPTFSDVTKNDWAYQYVEACAKYLTGYKVGNKLYFKGKENAVREDMAVAIVVAKGLQNEKPNYSLLDVFGDKSKISNALRGYVAIAVQYKIMEGDGKNFNPLGTLTRAEACALIYKSSLAVKGDDKIPVKEVDESNLYTYSDDLVSFNIPKGFYNSVKADKGLEFRYKNALVIVGYENSKDALSLYGASTKDDSFKGIVSAFTDVCRWFNNTMVVYEDKQLIEYKVEKPNKLYYRLFYSGDIGNDTLLVIEVDTLKIWPELSEDDKNLYYSICDEIINSFTFKQSSGNIDTKNLPTRVVSRDPIDILFYNDDIIRFAYPNIFKTVEPSKNGYLWHSPDLHTKMYFEIFTTSEVLAMINKEKSDKTYTFINIYDEYLVYCVKNYEKFNLSALRDDKFVFTQTSGDTRSLSIYAPYYDGYIARVSVVVDKPWEELDDLDQALYAYISNTVNKAFEVLPKK